MYLTKEQIVNLNVDGHLPNIFLNARNLKILQDHFHNFHVWFLFIF